MFSFSFYLRAKRYIARQLFRLLFSYKFKTFGQKVSLTKPDMIQGEQFISLGDMVFINSMAWILAIKQDGVEPRICIGEYTNIGRFVHIVALKNVEIEKNVLIADKVYISDNLHSYEDVNTSIIQQRVIFKNEVVIGENSWIGENVSIIGAKVGKHCVIGANSVVTKDIPDYSVAIGSPAQVVKVYSFEHKKWVQV
jgi:acetyltransferase-like isoleucine patch superfamily enzyme